MTSMLFSPRRLSRSIVMLIGMMTAASAAADVTLDVDLGYSMPSASDYQSSLYSSAALGYQSGRWLGRAGVARLGQFELEGGDEDTHLSSDGPFLMVSRFIQSEWVGWEFGLGAARLESAATLSGYKLQSESNWEPMAELAGRINLSQRWALKGGYTYFHDVVGSNVAVIAFGMRWSF